MRLLFTLTLFCSAVLLFLIQPMLGKMILPRLGGTPAVWNTCMVFFQGLLLAGYAYAHYTTRALGVRRQAIWHLPLLLLPFLVLPLRIGEGWIPPREANPIPWILALLFVTAGLPFFVVSTSAPLLQRWFAGTGHPDGRDPYFLYSASNLGSMLALLGYPILLEPLMRLEDQSRLWTSIYGVFVLLAIGCAALLWRSRSEASEEVRNENESPTSQVPDSHPLNPWRTLHWIALAFVPSSLMLAVTTYLTTDIAAIPLLWVMPLTIYLLTFIIVFAGKPRLPHPLTRLLLVVLTLFLLVLILAGQTQTLGVATALGLHLGLLFLVSLVCHGELARLRPGPIHLTTYFLAMSFGGVLGGLLNALFVPVVFTSLAEYPITLVLACLLLPEQKPLRKENRWHDLIQPVVVALAAVAAVWLTDRLQPTVHHWSEQFGMDVRRINTMLKFGAPAVLCLAFLGNPLRLGLAVGSFVLVGSTIGQLRYEVLHEERGFFGVIKVVSGKITERDKDSQQDREIEYRYLFHGNTIHGMELTDPSRRREPLAYYHRLGPIGQMMNAIPNPDQPRRVAVTGLGVGNLASYAGRGQEWTFYEIDPAVIRLAEDDRYFHFLADARSRDAKLTLELGDARLRLSEALDGAYDLIFMDAFSSDSVPVHLLTRQAVDLYFDKLTVGGLVVFNISNRYVDLEPVLAAQARDCNLAGLVQYDIDTSMMPFRTPSCWVVLARQESDLDKLRENPAWKPLSNPAKTAWTDDFSNLLGALRFLR